MALDHVDEVAVEHVHWLIQQGLSKRQALRAIGAKPDGGTTWVHVIAAYAVALSRLRKRETQRRMSEVA